MTQGERRTQLRPCAAADDAFLYDVFCTTWQDEVAALPNQNLAQHVLRIQHIAQERRFASRYPGHQRFVIVHDGDAAGRLYLLPEGPTLHLVDLTVLPDFHARGVAGSVLRGLFDQAEHYAQVIRARVSRSNDVATAVGSALGFRLVDVDDLDHYFEWTPATVGRPTADAPVASKEGPISAKKEGPAALAQTSVTLSGVTVAI